MSHATLLLKEIRKRELWSALQARLKFNPYHVPAGSPEGGQFTTGGGEGVGGGFTDAPMTQRGAKEWHKKMQARYANDPEFRAAVDATTLFTQGEYATLRAIGTHEINGTWEQEYAESSVPEWIDKPMAGSPLSNYKNYFEGQNVGDGSQATWGQGARALNDAIRTSEPLPQPFYRGLYGREVANNLKDLQPGAILDVVGPSSFTADETLAVKWSQNRVSGQRGGGLAPHVPSVVIEVQAGARGIKAAALSPWKQAEIISSGKFAVVSVTPREVEVPERGGYTRIQQEYRVVVQQTATWKNR